jgi:hypothetical protein
MRTRALILAALAASALTAPGMAQPADPAKPTTLSELNIVVHRSTRVSGVDVTASRCPKSKDTPGAPQPKLVSSFPARGAVVKPGLVIVRLTFDQPMTCKGFLATDFPLKFPCPNPLPGSLMTYDKRTFFTLCDASPGTRYGIQLTGFRSLDGKLFAGEELAFETSRDRRARTQTEAMAEDDWIAQAERAADAAR